MTSVFSSCSTLQCQRAVLENGLVVLVVENPVADLVSARFFMDAGDCYNRPEQLGLAHLAALLLPKGTIGLTALSIAQQIESIGASLGASSTMDYFSLTLKTVGADFIPMLRLAAELIQMPTFPDSELELERQGTLRSIRAQQEQPLAIALQQLRQSMYGEHPYGQSSLGTLESIAQIQRSHLQTFHQQFFQPNRTVLSISGNITLNQILPVIEEILGNWQGTTVKPEPLKTMMSHPKPTRSICIQENQQSIIMLGYLAPAIYEPDYPALKLLSTYLWNGLSSQLFTELREKKGLAYEVSGLYPSRRDTSHFMAYLGTAAQNTGLALSLLQLELERLKDQPLSQDTLEMSKRKLLGQYALGKQTNQQIAQRLGWYEYLNLGSTYEQNFMNSIKALTPEAVHQAATKYLKEPFISLVGSKDALSKV